MKVGDLVISRSPRLRGVQGLVVNIEKFDPQDRPAAAELFVVLWNTGRLEECQEWELSGVKTV